jgi:hypothetical protein
MGDQTIDEWIEDYDTQPYALLYSESIAPKDKEELFNVIDALNDSEAYDFNINRKHFEILLERMSLEELIKDVLKMIPSGSINRYGDTLELVVLPDSSLELIKISHNNMGDYTLMSAEDYVEDGEQYYTEDGVKIIGRVGVGDGYEFVDSSEDVFVVPPIAPDADKVLELTTLTEEQVAKGKPLYARFHDIKDSKLHHQAFTFSERTVNILKYLATINEDIIFYPDKKDASGKQLIGVMPYDDMVCSIAAIDESLNGKWGTDFNRFFEVYDLFRNPPTIELYEEGVMLGGMLVVPYGNPRIMHCPPKMFDIKFPETDISFVLTRHEIETFQAMNQGGACLWIEYDGNGVSLSVGDAIEPKHALTGIEPNNVVVKERTPAFKWIINMQNLILYPGSFYKVELSTRRISRWTTHDVITIIATENEYKQ